MHVNDEAIHGSDAVATSLILAEAVKKIGNPDLILTGMSSTDGTMASFRRCSPSALACPRSPSPRS